MRHVRRVRLVAPTADFRAETLEGIRRDLARLARPGVELSHVQLDAGPESVRTFEDEARALPGVLRRVVEAARDGVDAVILDCTGDIGLHEARALVNLPVIGPGETLRTRAAGRATVRLGAAELANDPLRTALLGIARGATAIVIGGTGWSDVAERLDAQLRSLGHEVDVLDPLPLALDAALRALDLSEARPARPPR